MFTVDAGDAGATIKLFAKQANVQVMFPTEQMVGVSTNAVAGDFTPREALVRMLAGTPFVVIEDPDSGALAVKRAKSPAAPVPAAADGGGRHRGSDENSDGETVKLGPYEVTGSHIKRLAGEGPAPVNEYSSDTIEQSGAMSLADFLQEMSFNSGSQQTINNPSGFSQGDYDRGASTINPRGLGPQRVLILIDGHRPVNFASPDSTGASVFDINSIPIEAVDSVDYLKDGASAIYGSDAIAGVLNLKLKQSFSGASTDAMIGDVAQPGGQGGHPLARSFNLIAGDSSLGTSYLVDVKWFQQTDNTIADYDRSKNTDFSSLGVRGENDSSTSTYPFSVDLTAAEAATAGLKTGAGWYVAAGGVPQTIPSVSQFTFIGSSKNNATDANRYNYAPDSQLIPQQNNWDLLFRLTHDFNANLSAFATILASDDQTHMLYTPDSVNSTSVTVNNASDLTAGSNPTYLSLPASNPYNPFGSTLGGTSSASSSFIGRTLYGPTRTYDIDSASGDFLAGLDGHAGSAWTWDATVSLGSNAVVDHANNNIRAADIQAALDGTLAAYPGSYLNPFGPSANQAMVNSLFVTSQSTAREDAYDGEVSATGPLFHLGYLSADAGPDDTVSLAAGSEWRHEQLDNNPDTANYVVAPVTSTPFDAGRTVTSEYIELGAPVAGRYLELQAAGRHDQYSAFGGTTNPKLAAVSQPLGFLKLRASYSQSFKAPDLGQLYNEPLTTYSSTQTLDPLNPLVPAQAYAQLSGGNPGLKPERGKVDYLGGVIDLDSVVKGLSFSVDHYAISLTNVISTFSTPAQLESSFPNLVVRGAPTAQAPAGPIEYFDYVPVNAAAYYWRGFDLGGHYKIPRTPIGNFTVDVETTRVMYFAYDAGAGQGPVNKAGQYNATGNSPGATPRWTGTVMTTWIEGRTSASAAMVYKGPWDDNANAPTAVWGENPLTLFNGTLSYKIPAWHVQLTLACDNIFNTPPPPNAYASPSDGFDISTYGAWAVGRFVSFRIKQDF